MGLYDNKYLTKHILITNEFLRFNVFHCFGSSLLLLRINVCYCYGSTPDLLRIKCDALWISVW